MKKLTYFRTGVSIALALAMLSFGVWAQARMIAVVGGGVAAAADVTAPTVSTATIGTNGTTLTLAMSETVTRSGGTFDVDCSTAGANITATYSSGSGSSSLVYTLGTTVNSGDTCNLDYNGAANGIEDAAGNDLAAITDKAITNNSTQGGAAIADSFGSDTSANYTSVYNGISISGGVAHGSAAWDDNIVYHETSTGSNNHYVQGKIYAEASAQNSRLILRCNGNGATSTGYIIGPLADDETIQLHRFSGSSVTYIDNWLITGTITGGTSYLVKAQISGSTISVWIDLNNDGDFNDTNESLGNKTDTTYGTGAYVGMVWLCGASCTSTVDDFSGGGL